jgi:hypothetical protein
MGASVSTSNTVLDSLNNVAINVMAQNSTTASTTSTQTNTVDLSGNVNTTVKLGDISQANTSNISVSALMASVQNGNLQTQLTTALSSAISQQQAMAIVSANVANVSEVVKNNVNANITQQNFQNIITQSAIHDFS